MHDFGSPASVCQSSCQLPLDYPIVAVALTIPDSDDIPNHIVIQDSDSPTSDIQFPVSDDELSDRMDVDVGSAEDMYISPVETGPSIRASGAMPRLQRDPTTGLFTPASFAHFPDDLLG